MAVEECSWLRWSERSPICWKRAWPVGLVPTAALVRATAPAQCLVEQPLLVPMRI